MCVACACKCVCVHSCVQACLCAHMCVRGCEHVCEHVCSFLAWVWSSSCATPLFLPLSTPPGSAQGTLVSLPPPWHALTGREPVLLHPPMLTDWGPPPRACLLPARPRSLFKGLVTSTKELGTPLPPPPLWAMTPNSRGRLGIVKTGLAAT